MKRTCTKCKRTLDCKNFEPRKDRIGAFYSWCYSCMKREPLFVSVPVNGEYVQVLERESRTVDYPDESDRGFGRVFG